MGLQMQMACFASDVLLDSVSWIVFVVAALGVTLMLLDSYISSFGLLAVLGIDLLLVALGVAADSMEQFFYTLSASAVLVGASIPVMLHRLPDTRMMSVSAWRRIQARRQRMPCPKLARQGWSLAT